MKLCLLFHCLCESYSTVHSNGQELFVSVSDVETMIQQLLDRGYTFRSPEDPGSNTVTITFDDGYYNNFLFSPLADTHHIPFIIFVSAYYLTSGRGFPWLMDGATRYREMADFDYYREYDAGFADKGALEANDLHRPFTIEELSALTQTTSVEIGCHGYLHQPLSKKFARYLERDRELAMSALNSSFGIQPRYYSLANGMYTGEVVRELLKTFNKVFTIEGRPFRPKHRVIHRLSLINPNLGGPLIEQIDRSLAPLRQVKRALRIRRRLLL